MPAVLGSSETLLFVKVIIFSELLLKFVVFLQHTSGEDHGPVSHSRDNTEGWDECGAGLAGSARAQRMAEGSDRHTGSVSQKGHHPGPTGALLLLVSWENCGSLSCQGLDLSSEPDLQGGSAHPSVTGLLY